MRSISLRGRRAGHNRTPYSALYIQLKNTVQSCTGTEKRVNGIVVELAGIWSQTRVRVYIPSGRVVCSSPPAAMIGPEAHRPPQPYREPEFEPHPIRLADPGHHLTSGSSVLTSGHSLNSLHPIFNATTNPIHVPCVLYVYPTSSLFVRPKIPRDLVRCIALDDSLRSTYN